MLGDDLSLVLMLAMGFGVVIGWQIYTALVTLLLRLNKNVPLFAWREGIISGTILLGIAIVIMAVGVWSAAAFNRLADAFLATIVGGAAAHQLWLCWLAIRSRPIK
jgi:hypothetical protein